MEKILLLIFLATSIHGFTQNVGIGTTVPTNTLDINGGIRIRGGNPVNGTVLTTDPSGNATWQALPLSPTSTFITKNGTYSSGVRNAYVTDSAFEIDITQTGYYFIVLESQPFPQVVTNGCNVENFDTQGATFLRVQRGFEISPGAGTFTWHVVNTQTGCQGFYLTPYLYTENYIQYLIAGDKINLEFNFSSSNTTTALPNWTCQVRTQMIKLN